MCVSAETFARDRFVVLFCFDLQWRCAAQATRVRSTQRLRQIANTRPRVFDEGDDNNPIALNAPVSKAGDFIVLRALQDVVVIFSACPMDITPVNGEDRTPKSVAYEIIDCASVSVAVPT
jgi:uncharacterized protein YcgI (DUF1989 family)